MFLTLFTTLASFLAGSLPRVLDFFQDRSDKKHEIELMKLSTERELELAKAGFDAKAKIEEIHTEQVFMETQRDERVSMYEHDAKIGEGASSWVINLRASVRPIVTYLFVALLIIVDITALVWAIQSGVPFELAMDLVFSDDEMVIVSSIIAFWFGTQAFSKKR